jgi:hypothetical protein
LKIGLAPEKKFDLECSVGFLLRYQGDRGMPIERLLKAGNLEPEEADRLRRAYARALRSLSLVDRNDPLTELVARKVIEIGATGVSDPLEISKIVIRKFGNP